MIPFLPLLALAAIGGSLAYGEYQRKRGAKNANNAAALAAAQKKSDDDSVKSKVQNIYNYNGLTDSTMGRTLFQNPQSQQVDPNNPLKKRTLFN